MAALHDCFCMTVLMVTGADGVQVGLVDSYMRWSALPGSGAGAEAAAAARDHMWANDITLRFLQSGKFVWCAWALLQ